MLDGFEDALESVEDQIEPECEGTFFLRAALLQMLIDVLDDVWELVGGQRAEEVCRQAGKLLRVDLDLRPLLPFLAHRSKDDLTILKSMIESGSVTPLIDRAYPLAETAEAIRYVEAGHARGKVVTTI